MSLSNRRARNAGKREFNDHERFAFLPQEVLESSSWAALPDFAKASVVALACGAHHLNNGRIALPWSIARRRGLSSEWKLYAGLQLAELAGLVRRTRQGRLQAGRKLPNLYALTWRAISDAKDLDLVSGPTISAPNDWARWSVPTDWKEIVSAVRDKARGAPSRQRARARFPKTGKIPLPIGVGRGRPALRGAESFSTTLPPGAHQLSPPAPPTLVASDISGGAFAIRLPCGERAAPSTRSNERRDSLVVSERDQLRE